MAETGGYKCQKKKRCKRKVAKVMAADANVVAIQSRKPLWLWTRMPPVSNWLAKR
jgi:hypothetical protein